MAVNISGLRRNIKNVAHNYTDAQVKVREATSNDPWGPSSTMMSEIADLTYNVVAYTEIMQMIWKRLNDNGKNWRHVYKALVLLEYLIKTGSDKVAQQCKENLFAIQTLKDFQYLDDNKDQGINVREKAKALVALLKDDERLKNERVRALKAKERFALSAAGIGSDTVYNESRDRQMMSGSSPIDLNSELEAARPQTVGEEELQLQLALAISRDEAEQEESKSKSDDMRLQLALQKSKELSGSEPEGFTSPPKHNSTRGGKPSSDLLDLDFGNPVVVPPVASSASHDPWGMPMEKPKLGNDPWGAAPNDPWSPVNDAQGSSPINQKKPLSENDPWSPIASNGTWNANPSASDAAVDPFSPMAQKELTEFDALRNEIEVNNGGTTSPNPFDLGGISASMSNTTGTKPKKSVNALLGEHSNLVNLDNLVTDSKLSQVRNPFEQQTTPNPFQVKQAKPAMNELLQQQTSPWQQPQPQQQNDFNPFF